MILIPVSIGELLDKISILQIKLEQITDATKLNFIKREQLLLMNTLSEHMHAKLLNHTKYQELYQVNLRLWHLEDDIRMKEKCKNFDDEFIELARQVYMTNDRRAHLKKYFNDMFNSEITEVKSYENYT